MKIIEIYLEKYKRKFYEKIQLKGRVKFPMRSIVEQLYLLDMLPTKINALEVFGRHGLWITKDYNKFCETIELWEIDPLFARYAKKFIPNANVFCGDTIEALKDNKICRKKFNFIVIDNSPGLFGNYCEHFEVLQYINKYIDNGILIFNIVTNIEPFYSSLSDDSIENWKKRRKKFYSIDEVERIQVPFLFNFYKKYFYELGFSVDYISIMPRNEVVTFCYLSINKLE